MTAEEIQNVIISLKNSIELFGAQLESVALGVPKNTAANANASSIITVEDQTESLQGANERNGDIGPSDIKYIDELYKKFKPLFDELKPKSSASLDGEASDVSDVLKGDETEKVTKVSIVSISDGALESLNSAFKGEESASAKGGGGFISGLLGMLGIGGAAAAGGGLIAAITALPAALPGIAVALGTIVAGAAAFAGAAAIIVKTISYLKEDIVGIFPFIKDFAKLFTEIAIAVIPVVGKAITDFVATVWPKIINALTVFASVVLPAVIESISALISSPGFVFIIQAFADVVSKTFGIIGSVLSNTIKAIKSIFSDTKDALISLFENIKEIVIPVIEGIKETLIAAILPIERTLKNLFNNIRAVLIPISNDVKEALVAIGEQVQNTVLGSLEKIDTIFSKIPDVFGSVFDKIAEFSNKVSIGRIGATALEIGALSVNLGLLTASRLLGGLANFFTKSPFEKIIEFQNNLDVNKLSVLSSLAPSLQKLMDVNVGQLSSISTVLDELINKSIEVSKTVEKVFSGSFFGSRGLLELVDRLEDAKQGAENTITSVMVKTSDAQRKISELQLNETKMTNRILSDIFKKMNTMSTSTSKAPLEARGNTVNAGNVPLQFTSTNTRAQIVQSGGMM